MSLRFRSAGRTRVAVVVLLLALLLIGAASAGGAAGTGTVKAKVEYRNSSGTFVPLAGVEVFLGYSGTVRYACTNGEGIAWFLNVAAGGGHIAATGVSISNKHCPNEEFLEPGTGRKLYAVYYKQHIGQKQWDGFDVAEGTVTTINFRTPRPPLDQNQVCGGQVPTILGTPGDDTLVGTAGGDVISGGGGNDVIMGLGNPYPDYDWLCGGPGSDLILGGPGKDVMFGEGGNDSGGDRGLFGGGGSDFAFGGPGTDTCDAEYESGCE